MVEKLITFSLRNRAIVLLVSACLFVWGIYSVKQNPIDAIPDLSENQVIVFTEWMGRSPQVIEAQVTYPLVSNLQGIPKVKNIKAKLHRKFDGLIKTITISKHNNKYYASILVDNAKLIQKKLDLEKQNLDLKKRIKELEENINKRVKIAIQYFKKKFCLLQSFFSLKMSCHYTTCVPASN